MDVRNFFVSGASNYHMPAWSISCDPSSFCPRSRRELSCPYECHEHVVHRAGAVLLDAKVLYFFLQSFQIDYPIMRAEMEGVAARDKGGPSAFQLHLAAAKPEDELQWS